MGILILYNLFMKEDFDSQRVGNEEKLKKAELIESKLLDGYFSDHFIRVFESDEAGDFFNSLSEEAINSAAIIMIDDISRPSPFFAC